MIYQEVFNILLKKFQKESSEFVSEYPFLRISEDKFKSFLWKALEVHALLAICFEGRFDSFSIRAPGVPASDIFVDLESLELTYEEGFYVGGKRHGLRNAEFYLHFFGTAPFEEAISLLTYSLKGLDLMKIKPYCVDFFTKSLRKGVSFRELVKILNFNQGELLLKGVNYV